MKNKKPNYVSVMADNGRFTTNPVLFVSAADSDGFVLGVAEAKSSEKGSVSLNVFGASPSSLGEQENPDAYRTWAGGFALNAMDDKKVIAQQLREMADWFEAQV